MTDLAAGRHRSVMARPMRPSMLVGVTRLHPAIATSTGRIARSLLFTTASSHVKIFGVNGAQRLRHPRPLYPLQSPYDDGNPPPAGVEENPRRQ
jgi:hypothetical protein